MSFGAYLQAAPALISGITSLFKKPKGPSELERQQLGLVKQQQGIAGQLQGYAGQERQRYNTLTPQRDQSFTGLKNYLQTDSFNDPYRARELEKYTTGVNNSYARDRASVLADAARNGVSPDSVSGRLSAVDANRAAAKSQGFLQVSRDAIDRNGQNLQALYNLMSGATNEAQGDANNYLGQAQNSLGNVAGQYGNLAANQYARTDQFNSEQGQNLGGIAQFLGQYLSQIKNK